MESFLKCLSGSLLEPLTGLMSLFLNHCMKDYMTFQMSGTSLKNITIYAHKVNELLCKFNLPFLFNCLSVDTVDWERKGAKVNIRGVRVTLVPRTEYVYEEEGEDESSKPQDSDTESESHTIPSFYDPTASLPQDIMKSMFQMFDLNFIDVTIRFEGTKFFSSTGIASEIKIQELRLYNKHSNEKRFETTEISRCIQISDILVYTDETQIDAPKLSNDGNLAESTTYSTKRIVHTMHPIRVATMHNLLELDLNIDLLTNSISFTSVINPDIAFLITSRQIDLLSKLASMFMEPPMQNRNSSTEDEEFNDIIDTQSVVTCASSVVPGSGMTGWSHSTAKEIGTSRRKSNSESMLYCSSEAEGSVYARSNATGATRSSRMTTGSIRSPRKCASLDLADLVDKFSDFKLVNLEMKLMINSVVGLVLHEDVLIKGGPATHVEMNNVSKEFLNEVNGIDLTQDHEKENYQQLEEMMTSLQKISQRCCRKNHFQLLSFNISFDLNYQRYVYSNDTIFKAGVGEMRIYENICDGSPLRQDRQDTVIELVSFCRSKSSYFPCIFIELDSTLNFEDPDCQILENKFSVTIRECSTELDLSVLNRIDAFFIEKYFFDDKYGKLSSSSINETSKFQAVPSSSNLETKLKCTIFFPNVSIMLRFPVPVFEKQSQKSNWDRNIRNDILTINFSGLQFGFVHDHQTPANKMRYHMEAESFNLLFQESLDSPVYKIASSNFNEKYMKVTIRTGCLPKRKMVSSRTLHQLSAPVGPFKKSNFTGSTLTDNKNTLVYPSSRENFRAFLEGGYHDVEYHITVDVDDLRLNVPSKHIYEVLYNRLAYDLTLFQLRPGHPLKQKPTPPVNLNNFSMDQSIYHSCLFDAEDVRSPSTTLGIEVKVSSVDILINTPYRDPVSNLPCQEHVGKLSFSCEDVLLQCGVGFMGNVNKTFLGIHIADGILKHSPQSEDHYEVFQGDKICVMKGPKKIFPTLRENTSSNLGKPSDLISMVIEFDYDDEKEDSTMTMALCLMHALYDHDLLSPYSPLWYSQLVDTFTVNDYPISGYKVPQTNNNIQVSAVESALTYIDDKLKTEITVYLDNLMLGICMSYECTTFSFSFLMEDMKVSLMKSGRYSCYNPRVRVFEIPCLELLYKKSNATLKIKGGDPMNDIQVIASDMKLTFHVDTLQELRLIIDRIITVVGPSSRNSSPDTNTASGRSRSRKDSSSSQINMKELQLAVNDISVSSLGAASESSSMDEASCSTFTFHDDRDKPILRKETNTKTTSMNEKFCFVETKIEKPKAQIKIKPSVKWASKQTPLSRNGVYKSVEAPEMRLKLKDVGLTIDICPGNALTPNYSGEGSGSVSCSTKTVKNEAANMTPLIKIKEREAYIKIKLKRVNFTLELYPEENVLSKNILFSIGDLEVLDKVPDSKLLMLVQKYRPPDSVAPSNVKFASIFCKIERTFDDTSVMEEASLELSLSSIRMYIDQAAISFIMDFCNSLQEMCNENNPDNKASQIVGQTVNTQTEDDDPLFVKSITFHPSVNIIIDFEGNVAKIKSFNELLASLCSSKDIRFSLKSVNIKPGKRGLQRALDLLFKVWTDDITGSQMIHQSKNLLTPVQDVLQFANGFLQFFLTPYHTYQKDGSIFKGIVLGSRQLGSHSLSATFNLLVKFLGVFENISAFFFMIVSNNRKREAITGPRPQTIREGMGATAEVAMDAYTNIVEGVLSGQESGDGYTGIVSAGIRHIPTIITAGPYIAITATTNLASGVQNQILPGTAEDVQNKYK